MGEGDLFKRIRLNSLRESPFAFGSDYQSAVSRDPASWREQADSTAEGSDRSTFLAFSDETPVGIMALYRREDETDIGDLLQVWVSPNFRGQGIATGLMNAVLRWAKEGTFRTVIATVARDNHRARQFYESCGFKPEDSTCIDGTKQPIVLVRECVLEDSLSLPFMRSG